MSKTIIDKFREDTDSDIIIMNASIDYGLISFLDQINRYNDKRKNVCLLLTTFGGSADLAFSFAKTLQTCYDNFTICITSFCKSAGTLIALGADEIVFSNSGELGPLDVQTYKPDELMSHASGLDIYEALNVIASKANLAFFQYFESIIKEGRGTITTMTAGDLSIKLVRTFIEPIARQVEPMQLGEMNRKVSISVDYGDRLCEHLDQPRKEAVRKLTRNYPSHGFVIDYDEMKKLINNDSVRKINKQELELCEIFYSNLRFPVDNEKPYFMYINNDTFDKTTSEESEQKSGKNKEPNTSENGKKGNKQKKSK